MLSSVSILVFVNSTVDDPAPTSLSSSTSKSPVVNREPIDEIIPCCQRESIDEFKTTIPVVDKNCSTSDEFIISAVDESLSMR